MQLFGLNNELEMKYCDMYSEYEFRDIGINSTLESIDYLYNQLENKKVKDIDNTKHRGDEE